MINYMKYLKLIRYQNLLLLALMQLIFRFGFLELIKIPLSLFYWQYTLLILATVLIAAGGYVINDIFDQETDDENKPEKVIIGKSISESMAYNIYAGLTITGVACGFILSNSIEHPNFAVIFILIATLLYFYASTLKQIPLLGNTVVAALLAFSVIIIGIFDIFPNTFDINRPQMAVAFSILFDYAKFAFIINLVREIIKDIEDIEGDKSQSMNTLPIAIGVEKTSKIAFVILLIPTLYLMYYSNTYLLENNLIIAIIYMLAVVIAPMIFCLFKIWNAKQKSDYSAISTVLKWIIFFGILSIAVVTLNILHHG
ncbi:geranylgeranylglycerol-phosphate geranylgeranyltransferase [Flavobacterium sp. SUN052]|uniref:geranylgeranylglycerol-phosphate geranylgeranyltransferase n=1 Tax=Flavobacterium sp. SUN052 TaxID=3002441 RepID=UPI00237D9D3D|nr:geranylgeranylglycerol-phosphate geranylgeranyltransferase [Flavobacterium sp. SUN052]MEC4005596.1 geranylgeranylglycerol-phosphate geranylgeranyltransferase [Flavobacterium sp. SUN052]